MGVRVLRVQADVQVVGLVTGLDLRDLDALRSREDADLYIGWQPRLAPLLCWRCGGDLDGEGGCPFCGAGQERER